MTWEEFKAKVEAAGVEAEDRIFYIDVSGEWDVIISRHDDNLGVAIYDGIAQGPPA